MKKQIIFLSSVLVLVIFSVFLTACAEDSDSSDSETQSTDKPQQGAQGQGDMTGDGKLCGDGTCDEAEEESGFCKADCE